VMFTWNQMNGTDNVDLFFVPSTLKMHLSHTSSEKKIDVFLGELRFVPPFTNIWQHDRVFGIKIFLRFFAGVRKRNFFRDLCREFENKFYFWRLLRMSVNTVVQKIVTEKVRYIWRTDSKFRIECFLLCLI
jgi:hypothetical protein